VPAGRGSAGGAQGFGCPRACDKVFCLSKQSSFQNHVIVWIAAHRYFATNLDPDGSCTYQLNQLLYHLHVVCQPAHQSWSRHHLAQLIHEWLTLYREKPCLTEGFEHLRGRAMRVQHSRYPDIRVDHGAHC